MRTAGASRAWCCHPHVTISAGDAAKAADLHHEAHRLCYVAKLGEFSRRLRAGHRGGRSRRLIRGSRRKRRARP